jgi:hypothetical protein
VCLCPLILAQHCSLVLDTSKEPIYHGGEYQDELPCMLSDGGVIEAIQRNSPAVTSVAFNWRTYSAFSFPTTSIVDYAAAGQALGKSSHVQHLKLTVILPTAHHCYPDFDL